MYCARTVYVFMLLAIVGCGNDIHCPQDGTGEPEPSDMENITLSVTASADTIARGDTLRVHMVAVNTKRAPIDVWFPESCQDGMWVYDADGRHVGPHYTCLTMPSRFHMDPLEKREYNLKWRACGEFEPGQFRVEAGFHPVYGIRPLRADPLAVEVVPTHEDVTGSWEGSSFDFWGIPGWLDYRISLTLNQANSTVSGNLAAGGPQFEIYSGSIHDTAIVFTIRLESDDLEIEFTGDVCGDGMEGMRRLRRLSTGEKLDTQYWYVYRAK